MPQYKGLVVFSGGPAGWTESYYLLQATPSGAATDLLAIITARLAVLQDSLIVIAASISDVSKRGDSIVVLSTPELGTAADTAGYIPLDSALLIKWQVGIYNRNKTFLHGIPVSLQTDGFFTGSIPFNADLNTYFSAVIAHALFPVTARNVTPPPAYNVLSYSPATAGAFNARLARRKIGRPIGLPRGRRVAP